MQEEKKCPSSLRESIHFLSLSQKRQNKSSCVSKAKPFVEKAIKKHTHGEKNWCFRVRDFVFFVRQSVLIKGLLLSLISREENYCESLLRKK